MVYIGIFYGFCKGMVGWVVFGEIIGVWSGCFWDENVVEIVGVKWGLCGRGSREEGLEWMRGISGGRGIEGFVWGKMIGIFYN